MGISLGMKAKKAKMPSCISKGEKKVGFHKDTNKRDKMDAKKSVKRDSNSKDDSY